MIGIAAAMTLAITGSSAWRVSAPTGPISYSYTSDPGDWVGQGGSGSYTPDNAKISLTGLYGNGPPTVTGGFQMVVTANNGDWWYINVAPPKGQSLQVGYCSDVQRAAFREGSHPGLDVFGNGRGCNNLTGDFTIVALGQATTGTVPGTIGKVSATFNQHCEGAAPALHGTVHYLA